MKKIFLDITVLVLFLLVMSFHFLPRILHEIFGLIMPVAVAIHLIENRRWFLNLNHGKWTKRKIFSALINFSILLCFFVILAAGICMSNYIFNEIIPLDIRRNMTIHQLHVSLPYVLMILIGVHVGLHWREIWNRFINFVGVKKNSCKYKVSCCILSTVIICFGIYGAFLNRVGDRILMKHIFATPATELSWAEFLFLFVATGGIFSAVTFWLDEKFFSGKK